ADPAGRLLSAFHSLPALALPALGDAETGGLAMPETTRNAMTKADLINIVAKRLEITQVQSGIIVEAALRSVVNALQSGQEVEIRGFGSFRFRNRAPRKGRNPKTGEKV